VAGTDYTSLVPRYVSVAPYAGVSILMKSIYKYLFCAEVAIFFTPLLLFFLSGTIMLPFQVYMLATQQEIGSLYYLIGYIVGVSGLVALVIVLRYILDPTRKMPRRITTVSLMIPSQILLLWLAESAATSSYAGEQYWAFIYGMPLLVSAHAVYLARSYFWG